MQSFLTVLMKFNDVIKFIIAHNWNYILLLSSVFLASKESNDRLQVHLKERMHALEEKNALQQELDKLRKVLEDLQGEKVINQNIA